MKRNQNTIFLRKYKNEDAYKVFLFFKKQNVMVVLPYPGNIVDHRHILLLF